MSSMSVIVFGHHAKGARAADGQTVKTRTVHQALVARYGEESVSLYDTHKWKKSPIKLLAACVAAARKNTDVVVMPAHNGVRVFLPIFYILSIFFKFRTHYLVIGGWIAALSEKKCFLRYVLKRTDYIYTETETLKIKLMDQGMVNVEVVPNFKDIRTVENIYLKNIDDGPRRLCTFSRVTEQKGIGQAIDSVIRVNESLGKIAYTLDVYGKIDEDYEEKFRKIIDQSPSYIKYGGVVDYSSSTDILSTYYMLLFPTLFYTEGIPGTIIDAYAAGLPVISARWESFRDIISEDITGFGYTMGDADALTRLLEIRLEDADISKMRRNCMLASKGFTAEQAMKPVYARISATGEAKHA